MTDTGGNGQEVLEKVDWVMSLTRVTQSPHKPSFINTRQHPATERHATPHRKVQNEPNISSLLKPSLANLLSVLSVAAALQIVEDYCGILRTATEI